jgi:hypothetical protein
MGVPASTATGLQWEGQGSATKYTLTAMWPGEREWYERQGIQVRTGDEPSEARRSAKEAEQAEQLRVIRKWQEATAQWGPATGEKRIKRGPPQEPQPVPTRDTVEVEMKYGESRRQVSVPSNTSEEGIVQLLVSAFGENMRRRWRVITRNLSLREMEEYGLPPRHIRAGY